MKMVENLRLFKFFKGKRGDVISRLPSGKIVLVNRKSSVMPRDGEEWLCRVDFEKERFAVVTPLTKEVLVKSVYKCGHIEMKRVSVSEVERHLDKLNMVGGDAVVEYYYPFHCSECCSKEVEEMEEEMKEKVEEELNEFFEKAKKIVEKITPKPEFNKQFQKPTWQEDAKKFIAAAVEKGQKIVEIDDMPGHGWWQEYPTSFTNGEKVARTVAYVYKGVTVPTWVFIDDRAENGIDEFKLLEWIKTLPKDNELRRKAEAEEKRVMQYYRAKDEARRKWKEENDVYLKMLFELYERMSFDAQIAFDDEFLENGVEVYETLIAWMEDEGKVNLDTH